MAFLQVGELHDGPRFGPCPSAYCPCARDAAARSLSALVVVLGVAGCGLFGGDGPDEAAQAFAAAWSAGDDRGAAALTDDPAAATELLTAVRAELAPASLSVQVGRVRTASDAATASLDLRWDLGQGASGAMWARSACAAPGAVTAPRGRSPGRRPWCTRSWPPASGSS